MDLKVWLPFLLHLVSQTMMFPSLPPVQKTAERAKKSAISFQKFYFN